MIRDDFALPGLRKEVIEVLDLIYQGVQKGNRNQFIDIMCRQRAGLLLEKLKKS